MADNITLNEGTGGATLATDDAGAGGHVQIVKLALSADGSATAIAADANGLEVQGAGTAGTATGGVVTVQGVASMTPIQVGDNSGSLTVDVGTALPAGTNNIGDVDIASIAAGTNNIGDVDVASIAAGDNNIGNVDVVTFPAEAHSTDYDTGAGTDTTLTFGIAVPASGGAGVVAGGGGTEATALRVTVASDSTGVLSVDDNGGNLSIDDGGNVISVDWNGTAPPIGAGTEAAALRVTVATDSTGVVSVDDNGGTLTVDNAALSVTGGGAEATALRVTIASDSTGVLSVDDNAGSLTVDNGGTFAVQVDGSALTALQLIDNPVIVDDAAFTPATSSVMMAGFEADEASIDSVDEGDAGAARMTLDRKVIVTAQPHTAGGLSIFRSLDLDETEEDVKTSAGQVYACWVTNTATATRFIKFYNATAANVTVGSTTPVITIGIPGNSSDDVAAHLAAGGHGIAFGTAICVAATTGVADNDTGAPGANEIVINVFYK